MDGSYRIGFHRKSVVWFSDSVHWHFGIWNGPSGPTVAHSSLGSCSVCVELRSCSGFPPASQPEELLASKHPCVSWCHGVKITPSCWGPLLPVHIQAIWLGKTERSGGQHRCSNYPYWVFGASQVPAVWDLSQSKAPVGIFCPVWKPKVGHILCPEWAPDKSKGRWKHQINYIYKREKSTGF